MIDELSIYAASFFSSRDEEDENLFKIYRIGMDVLLSTGITIVGILGLAIVLHNLQGAMLFLLCFITVRSYSGGYHASTRLRCFFLTCSAYLCTAFISKCAYGILLTNLLKNIVFILTVFDFGVFARFVPIQNKNKKLPSDWKQRNRKRAWFNLILWKLIAILMYRVNAALSLQILATESVITILILWCTPWRRKT